MKLLLGCLLICTSLFGQSVRWIGTNVVDFSFVERAVSTPQVHGFERPVLWHEKYLASGKAEKVEDGTLTLLDVRHVYKFRADAGRRGSADHLARAKQFADPSGTITPWQYMALPPQWTAFFYEAEITTPVTVRHFDRTLPAERGVRTTVIAWPLASNVFEFGKTFSGDLATVNFFRPTSNGVVYVKAPNRSDGGGAAHNSQK